MRDPFLENEISDILLKLCEDYSEHGDNYTTSDWQGVCGAQAYKIIELVKESGEK